ncbi:hypothetical protein QEZ54_02660 [Catellatospora sp. KI3]|uniref:hypothetical protein n=1 Tax=Catellatospora sp. KI3 TaxID=3041620 RepID=UPI00248299DA|nr:hypothetical protein [Catellatospora sp. KI3]MDI1459859.1 hypothetical protein [Catellatospora sp. KI3]
MSNLPTPPRKSSSTVIVIVLVVAVAALCCCGVGGWVAFRPDSAASFVRGIVDLF